MLCAACLTAIVFMDLAMPAGRHPCRDYGIDIPQVL